MRADLHSPAGGRAVACGARAGGEGGEFADGEAGETVGVVEDQDGEGGQTPIAGLRADARACGQ